MYHNVDIERGILSAIIYDGCKIDLLKGVLYPESFYMPFHQNVFKAMVELDSRDMPIDEVFLKDELVKMNQFDEEMFFELLATAPIETIEEYAEALLSLSQKRELLHLSNQIKTILNDDSEDIISKISKDLEEIASKTAKSNEKSINFYIQKMEEQIQKAKEFGGIVGYKSGIHTLDTLIGAFAPGDLVIIAARPSMGKTSFATTLIEHNLKLGHGVLFDSLEMPGEKIMQRLIASYSGNTLNDIKRGALSNYSAYKEAVEFYKNSELVLHDESYLTIHKLKAKAFKVIREKKNIKFWIIDHLRYIKKPGQNIANEISEITKEFKKIAKEHGIVVVLLSQLNRENEKSANKKPTLAGIRESGAVEEDADIVIGLHRESYYKRNETQTEPPVNEAELIVLKNRDGQAGVAKCFFNGPLARFQNYGEINIKEDKAMPVDIPVI